MALAAPPAALRRTVADTAHVMDAAPVTDTAPGTDGAAGADAVADPGMQVRSAAMPRLLAVVAAVVALGLATSGGSVHHLGTVAGAHGAVTGALAGATLSEVARPAAAGAAAPSTVVRADAVPFDADPALAPVASEAAPDVDPIPFAPPVTQLGGVPSGMGMWTWEVDQTEGGDVHAIVAKAKEIGLTHVYVRTGSSWRGLHGTAFLDELLPVAHQAGLRVYGWDFPNFVDVAADIDRAVAAVRHEAPSGHRIDGFVADIETRSEGTRLTPEAAEVYSAGLRAAVGPDTVLIACVPNPTPHHLRIFPYSLVLPHYDAVAPMIYWLNRQPDEDARRAMDFFRPLGLPVIPVGQAYDGGPEGGRPGPPTPDELRRFVGAVNEGGAVGMSFWSWQHAVPQTWQALAEMNGR
jgi:hypothetical protein